MRWVSAWLCSVAALCGVVGEYPTHVRVLNRSRPGSALRVGDVVEVSCPTCSDEGGLSITDWSVHGVSAKLLEQSSTSLVVSFSEAGTALIESSFNASFPQDDLDWPSIISLSIKRRAPFCTVWRSCFTHSLEPNADCVTSWTNFSNTGAGISLRLWLAEVQDNLVEKNNTGEITEEEKRLTEEAYKLGERPQVSILRLPFTFSEDALLSFYNNQSIAKYHPDENFWSVQLESSKFAKGASSNFPGGISEMLVQGQSISMMGCSTPSTFVTLQLQAFPVQAIEPIPAAYRVTTGPNSLHWDYCTGFFAARSTAQGYLWAIHDPISASARYTASRSVEMSLLKLFEDDSLSLVDFIPMREGVVALASDGKIYRLPSALTADMQPYSRASLLSGAPTGVDMLGSVMGCDFLLDANNRSRNDILVAWRSSGTEETRFYLSLKGGLEFTPVVFSETPFQVVQVLPLVSLPSILVLARDASGIVKLFSVNDQAMTVTALVTFGEGQQFPSLGNSIGIVSPVAPSGELFLYGDKKVFYSPSAGHSWKEISLTRFSLSTFEYVPTSLRVDEKIHQVVTSLKGDYAVVTSTGRVFRSKQGLVQALEVYTPLRVDPLQDVFTTLFRPSGEMFAIHSKSQQPVVSYFDIADLFVAETDDNFNATLATADVEAFASNLLSSQTPFRCPYLDWWQEYPSEDSFYMDMNDSIESKMLLTHDSSEDGLHVAFQTSNRNLLQMIPGDASTSTNADGSIMRRTRHLTLSVPPDISKTTGVGFQSHASGKVVIRAGPTRFNLGCNDHLYLMQISVGCPRGRHLRYRAPDAFATPSKSVVSPECKERAAGLSGVEYRKVVAECSCEKYTNAELSISKTSITRSTLDMFYASIGQEQYVNGLDTEDEDEITYRYDLERFGCPTYVPYTELFKPHLEIWDSDKFVKEVEADFTVIETHGRVEVSFAQTAAQVGCLRPPDSWASKFAKDPNLFTAWGSHNHQSCFVAPEDGSSSGDEDAWRSAVYQVLNKSSTNHLVFSKYSTEVPFQFFVSVVDPDYSFCTLQTSFAVEPYGMPMDFWTTFLVIFYVVLCSMALLGCTYLVHRRDMLATAAAETTKKNN